MLEHKMIFDNVFMELSRWMVAPRAYLDSNPLLWFKFDSHLRVYEERGDNSIFSLDPESDKMSS